MNRYAARNPLGSESANSLGRQPRGRCGRVLLAEDDITLCRMVHDVLRLNGFDVVVATDGREAMELFRLAGPYDVLLLDDEMPGLTGRQLLALLRAEGVSTGAVLHTGNPEVNEVEGLRLNARLLRKPSCLKALIAAVRSAMAATQA